MRNVHAKIGQLIRAYRTKKGMSQGELAKMLGHSTPQFVSFIERGLSKSPLQTLGVIIGVLGIPEKKILALLVADYKEELTTDLNLGKRQAKKLA